MQLNLIKYKLYRILYTNNNESLCYILSYINYPKTSAFYTTTILSVINIPDVLVKSGNIIEPWIFSIHYKNFEVDEIYTTGNNSIFKNLLNICED